MPTKIEWTEETLNPVVGCDKVSEGCKNCYAINMANRLQGMPGSKDKYAGTVKRTASGLNWTGKVNTHQATLDKLVKPHKPTKWFVNSMSDLFHDDIPFEFIDKVFAAMACCPDDIFQILTKRDKRMLEWFQWKDTSWKREGMQGDQRIRYYAYHLYGKQIESNDWVWPLPNVHLGVSVENNKNEHRVKNLLLCPAAIHWVSAEPLLSHVDFTDITWDGILFNALTGVFDLPEIPHPPIQGKIDWIVVGGESGANARPMHPGWVRSIRDQCKDYGVPFLFKQWGEWYPYGMDAPGTKGKYAIIPNDWSDSIFCSISYTDTYPRMMQLFGGCCVKKIGKKVAGRKLDGVEYNEYPV